MKIMFEHSHPFGFINCKIIKGVAKTKRGHYIVDEYYNYLRCDDITFHELLDLGYPLIQTKRKGV